MDYLYIIIGIILLILSGNYLVKSSSNLAKYFKIPPIIIGGILKYLAKLELDLTK